MIDILDFIPYGTTDKPITRADLAQLTGLDDRNIRVLIAKAKREYPIINVGEGYYVPDDPDDPNLRIYIHKEMHRIKEISKGLKTHKRFYNIDRKQERLNV